MKQNHLEFLRKLHALLSEYDAHIYWNFDSCSDMHGVTGEGIGIGLAREEIISIDGMHLSAYDLKHEIK